MLIWGSGVQKKNPSKSYKIYLQNLPFPNLNCHAQQGSDKEFINMWKEPPLDMLKMSSIHY